MEGQSVSCVASMAAGQLLGVYHLNPPALSYPSTVLTAPVSCLDNLFSKYRSEVIIHLLFALPQCYE